MEKVYKDNEYNVEDLLQYGFDHINSGKILLCGKAVNCYDSGGYLIHLGIELVLKACLLDKLKAFDNTHRLKKLTDQLGLLLTEDQKNTLAKLQRYYDLRYPQPNGNVSLGPSDWGKIESLINIIVHQFTPSVNNAWDSIDRLKKGGRTLLVYPGFSVSKAAKYLGVTSQTLRNWEKEGKLIPNRRVNNYREYTIDQLEYFKNSNLL